MLPKKLQAMNFAASESSVAPTLSRRGFLISAAATATGLAIGYQVLGAKASAGAAGGPLSPFASYVEISEDGVVTVLSSQFEMGQGAYHGLATLVVEELGANWDQVTVRGVSANNDLYGNLAWGGVAQGSGGSTSMATSWDRYRKAGAAAREMLIAAAAQSWGVPAAEISVKEGVVSHASGRSAGFGALVKAAASQPVPTDIALKAPSEWTEIGSESTKRYDRVGKTNGAQDFTIDVKLPGMLTAVMIHPPKFGATVAGFDAAEAKQIAGVHDVIAIPRGVAVVAKDMWTALKARDLVTVSWDESQAETRGIDEIFTEYRALAEQAPTAMARNDGDAAAAIGAAETVLEATYEFPFLAHAALEPLNAIAHRDADGVLNIYGGHQIPDLYHYIVSQVTETPMEQIRMVIMKTGGGFGRRAVGDGDVVAEAAMIARAIGYAAPVKVQWTRENDMRGGRYRPAYVHKMRAGLDKDGKLVGFENHIVGQSIVAGTPFEGLIQNGIDQTSVEGASNQPYAIPNVAVGLTTTDVKVPVLWWRAVGSTHTAYAVETFMDEIIEATGGDPVQYRLDLLKDHPRHAGVLKLAAEKAGYGKKALPEGHYHGVSVHESFASYVAEIAEVSVEGGEVVVHKVTAAVDVGTAINPDTIKAQVEGGVGFGLGSVLQEDLTLTQGAVDQGNYDSYMPLRIDQMPEIDVHIVESDAPPTGIGEPGLPPIGPAVANAVYRATGTRVRILPFAKGMVA
ncbi:MAG: xanthine dehydrogenase family protein molybdopterin-binding subunit [Alphaproteobacteria bacterium]|nr:xanthine dehydrogenase family protein molybdopterin-binding subunit [Alphaproteobacteria bacterium]